MAYNVQRDTLFSFLGLYISWKNFTDEDLACFGCLYKPMDFYCCICLVIVSYSLTFIVFFVFHTIASTACN